MTLEWIAHRLSSGTLTSLLCGMAWNMESMIVFRAVQGLLGVRALGNRNFLLGCFLSFVTGVGIFATIYLTPLFLGYVRGYSAWQTGVAIASTGAAQLIGVPIYVKLSKRFDMRWLMMFGLPCFSLPMWTFVPITHDSGSDQLFYRKSCVV